MTKFLKALLLFFSLSLTPSAWAAQDTNQSAILQAPAFGPNDLILGSTGQVAHSSRNITVSNLLESLSALTNWSAHAGGTLSGQLTKNAGSSTTVINPGAIGSTNMAAQSIDATNMINNLDTNVFSASGFAHLLSLINAGPFILNNAGTGNNTTLNGWSLFNGNVTNQNGRIVLTNSVSGGYFAVGTNGNLYTSDQNKTIVSWSTNWFEYMQTNGFGVQFSNNVWTVFSSTNTDWVDNQVVTGWELLQGPETNSSITVGSGTGLLGIDANGGRSAVTVGANLTLAAGTLSANGAALPSGTNNGDTIVYDSGLTAHVYPLGQLLFTRTTSTNATPTNLTEFVTGTTNVPLPNGYSASVEALFEASGSTNSALWKKFYEFRNNAGTISLTSSNQVVGPGTGVPTNWNCQIVAGGTNLLAQGVGDANETVNWRADIRVGILTNATQFAGGGGGSYNPATDASVVEWLKADSLSQSDGSSVFDWTASTGLDATNVSVAFAPLFHTNFKNGLPVIAFTNTSSQVYLTTTADMATLSQPYAIWVVFKYQSLPAFPAYLYDGMDSTHRAANGFDSGTTQLFAYSGTVADYQAADTKWHTAYILYNGASSKAAIDGGAQSTISIGANQLIGLCVGSDEALAHGGICYIGELIVQNATPANVPSIFTYFTGRWGAMGVP